MNARAKDSQIEKLKKIPNLRGTLLFKESHKSYLKIHITSIIGKEIIISVFVCQSGIRNC